VKTNENNIDGIDCGKPLSEFEQILTTTFRPVGNLLAQPE